VGEGATAFCVYLDGSEFRFTSEAPAEGVSAVRCFPHGIVEFAAVIEGEGLWTDDEVLQARVDGTAVELVVAGSSTWVLRSQLEPIRTLRGLRQGGRCELEAFLEAYEEEQGEEEEMEPVTHAFDTEAWRDVAAFILNPHEPLPALADARDIRYGYRRQQQCITRMLVGVQTNAWHLRFPPLLKAATEAISEVAAMPCFAAHR
jgi:hypothetical protein